MERLSADGRVRVGRNTLGGVAFEHDFQVAVGSRCAVALAVIGLPALYWLTWSKPSVGQSNVWLYGTAGTMVTGAGVGAGRTGAGALPKRSGACDGPPVAASDV